MEDCGCAYRDPHDQELGELSIAWTLEHADPASKDFMRDLPFDLRFELGGKRVRLLHGSPRKVNEYLFEDKPAHTFERIARGAECDVLVFGHTHKPWIHEYGESCSSTVARSESPRTPIDAAALPCWRTPVGWCAPASSASNTTSIASRERSAHRPAGRVRRTAARSSMRGGR